MAVSVDDIEAFHRFALGRVSEGQGDDLTLDDLFIEFDSVTNRDEINAAIRSGIADVDAGRTRAVEDFNAELEAKYKLGR